MLRRLLWMYGKHYISKQVSKMCIRDRYKAAEELQEPYAGVRYQYLDENGNTIYTGMDTQIKDSDIHAVLKENEKQKFAKVYSWDTMPLRLGDLGIEELEDVYKRQIILCIGSSASPIYRMKESMKISAVRYVNVYKYIIKMR